MFQDYKSPKADFKNSGFLFLRSSYRYEKINKSEILYIKGMREYLMVFLEDRKVITYMNFESIIKLLAEYTFVRIHKSYAINLHKISYLDCHYVKIQDHQIPIGRVYKESFFNCLKEFKMII